MKNAIIVRTPPIGNAEILLLNSFSIEAYILLLASNGARNPNTFLFKATSIIDPIQYTMLIPILIKILGEIILIVPTIKMYCKITSENNINSVK